METPIGNFTTEEINLKECAFDKDADAVIISHEAVSNFNEEYNLVTDHKIKLKILKEKGIEKANIKIRYYSDKDFEFISNLKAVILSYNDDHEIVKSNLNNKNIYNKKIHKLFSEISFTMPNVKVGSIIEYTYTSIMKHYGGLDSWYFQNELPVMLSSYRLYILPGAEFAYTVYRTSDFPIEIKPHSQTGSIYYSMKNIPGLRDEVYMGAARDYLQRVNFQLSNYDNNGIKTKYVNTWKQLAEELMMEKLFGTQLNKTLPNVAKTSWETASSPDEKMKLVYNYVRSNMVWDNIYSKYSSSIKDAWEKKKGNGGDINLILINLLNEAGLDVSPMLVSERDNGKVDTTYPYLDQFNKVVAYVTINGQSYILDATDKQTPLHLIPFSLLNTKGFIVDKKNSRFVTISNSKTRNLNVVSIRASLDKAGKMRGVSTVSNYDYSKIQKKEDYVSSKTKYQEDFSKPYSALLIDSFKVDGLDSDTLPLKHDFNMSYELTKSGDYYLLTYNFFTGLTKNPFISNNRFSTIDFGTQYTCIANENFALPDNLQLETLPKNIKLVTPDNSMVAYREITKEENTLRINLKIEINKSEYSANEYAMVKDFYNKVFDTLNEPILLKDKL